MSNAAIMAARLMAEIEEDRTDPCADLQDALEDATRIILAYYNICRDLGHTTPVMTDAREFLRQYAPQEVW